MKGYKVQMMTQCDYHEYMTGGYRFHVENIEIVADTKEQAIEKAKYLYPGMVVNTYAEECEITAPVEDQMTLADLL